MTRASPVDIAATVGKDPTAYRARTYNAGRATVRGEHFAYSPAQVFRVLVIEDNPDMRDLMRVILEGAGYAVDLAEDGEAGLRALRARRADLIVTDIFMPNRDGLEIIPQLRADYPTVKVLAISGGGSVVKATGYLATAREVGAHSILAKPFDQQELLRAVSALLH